MSNTASTSMRWANVGIAAGAAIFFLSLYLADPSVESEMEQSAFPRVYRPAIVFPPDNPASSDTAELGRHLFYDERLSFNNKISCASCHQQEKAFTDGLAFSVGATGELTQRSSMTLANVAYNATLTWADSSVKRLEQQAMIPLTSTHPLEMGISGHEEAVMQRLARSKRYQALFASAFPNDKDRINLTNVIKALASFQRTLLSYDSPYDQFMAGNTDALDEQAERGLTLFFSERVGCGRCHGGHNFRFTPGHRRSEEDNSVAYHNTGLYNVDGEGAYPASDQGLIEVTANEADMGKFKAPTLRNIALTAPYMHDGSVATLKEVLEHYASGGRRIASGEHAGDGSLNPFKSNLISGFVLTEPETQQLLAFLHSLTDTSFTTRAAHGNPWESEISARE